MHTSQVVHHAEVHPGFRSMKQDLQWDASPSQGHHASPKIITKNPPTVTGMHMSYTSYTSCFCNQVSYFVSQGLCHIWPILLPVFTIASQKGEKPWCFHCTQWSSSKTHAGEFVFMWMMDHINQCGCMVQHLTCILFLFLFQYKLTVPKMGNVADLLAVLTKETNIPRDKVRYVLVSLVYIF